MKLVTKWWCHLTGGSCARMRQRLHFVLGFFLKGGEGGISVELILAHRRSIDCSKEHRSTFFGRSKFRFSAAILCLIG